MGECRMYVDLNPSSKVEVIVPDKPSDQGEISQWCSVTKVQETRATNYRITSSKIGVNKIESNCKSS